MAGAAQGPDTRAADLAAFGLADDEPPPELEIWPENLETVEVFAALQTQWQYHGFSGARLGLRYEAVAACLDLMGVADRAGVFEGLRTMEIAALDVFAEREAHA